MLLSLENPGPRKPWDWSRMKRSVVPAFPVTWMESVFVVVAPLAVDGDEAEEELSTCGNLQGRLGPGREGRRHAFRARVVDAGLDRGSCGSHRRAGHSHGPACREPARARVKSLLSPLTAVDPPWDAFPLKRG
jgi:hypothetical protein